MGGYRLANAGSIKREKGDTGDKHYTALWIEAQAPEIKDVYTGKAIYTDQTFNNGLNGNAVYNLSLIHI